MDSVQAKAMLHHDGGGVRSPRPRSPAGLVIRSGQRGRKKREQRNGHGHRAQDAVGSVEPGGQWVWLAAFANPVLVFEPSSEAKK